MHLRSARLPSSQPRSTVPKDDGLRHDQQSANPSVRFGQPPGRLATPTANLLWRTRPWPCDPAHTAAFDLVLVMPPMSGLRSFEAHAMSQPDNPGTMAAACESGSFCAFCTGLLLVDTKMRTAKELESSLPPSSYHTLRFFFFPSL